jgi:hypothetical protein
LSGDIREVGTMSTKRKRSAKKVASKKNKGASKKRSAMSAVEPRVLQDVFASAAMRAVERRALRGVLAEFRATTRWPRKEEVEGYDRTAFDVPGYFEAVAIKYRIWPWDRVHMLDRSSVFGVSRKTSPFIIKMRKAIRRWLHGAMTTI